MNSDDEITEYQPNYYPLRNGLGHESNYLYQKTVSDNRPLAHA